MRQEEPSSDPSSPSMDKGRLRNHQLMKKRKPGHSRLAKRRAAAQAGTQQAPTSIRHTGWKAYLAVVSCIVISMAVSVADIEVRNVKAGKVAAYVAAVAALFLAVMSGLKLMKLLLPGGARRTSAGS